MKTELELTAVRDRVESGIDKGSFFTSFYAANGKLYARMPPNLRQPKFGQKSIVINCFRWQIKEWIKNF